MDEFSILYLGFRASPKQLLMYAPLSCNKLISYLFIPFQFKGSGLQKPLTTFTGPQADFKTSVKCILQIHPVPLFHTPSL